MVMTERATMRRQECHEISLTSLGKAHKRKQ